MLGGTFDKNKIKDKIKNFDKNRFGFYDSDNQRTILRFY